jgi:putative ABC transport system ATP-binding protein
MAAMILTDEVPGNLRSQHGEEIIGLFRELSRQGRTIEQVTHSESNAAFGNRIVRLRDGWIEKL